MLILIEIPGTERCKFVSHSDNLFTIIQTIEQRLCKVWTIPASIC